MGEHKTVGLGKTCSALQPARKPEAGCVGKAQQARDQQKRPPCSVTRSGSQVEMSIREGRGQGAMPSELEMVGVHDSCMRKCLDVMRCCAASAYNP